MDQVIAAVGSMQDSISLFGIAGLVVLASTAATLVLREIRQRQHEKEAELWWKR